MELSIDDRKIWWIASYPKSGNTWVRMFLNAYVSGFPLDMNSGFQYAMGDNYINYFQSVYCRPVDNLTAREQAFIRPAVLMTALNMSACKHVCLKTHHAKVVVEDIPLIPSKISGGGVYIIRDPRDVAISFADHTGGTINEAIENMGNKQYISAHVTTKLMHVLTTWSLHVKTWNEKNRDIPITIIRYEEMLEKTEDTFRVILNALGFKDIDEAKFQFALEQTTFSNLQKLEEDDGFREKGKGEKFFRVGTSGQWKEILSEAQVDTIEKDHGEVMEEYGYELATVGV